MPHLMRSTALIALLIASPAVADITPDDAWAIWQAQAQAAGLTLTAEQHRDGDALVIDNARLTFAIPDEDALVFLAFNGVRFDPATDGSVLATFPETLTMTMGANDEGIDVATVSFTGANENYQGVITGTPDDVTAAWSADGLTMTLGDIVIEGEKIEGFTGAITLAGPVALVNQTTLTDTHVTIAHSSDYAGFGYAMSGVNVDDDGQNMEFNGSFESSVGTSHLVLPRYGIDVFNLPDQLRNGLQLSSSTTMGRYETTQLMSENGTVIMDQATVAESQNFSFSLGKGGVVYDAVAGQMTMKMVSSEFPFPMDFSLKSALFYFSMPLLREDGDQRAAFRMVMEELLTNEEIWALFDPEAQISHAPSTIKLDISASLDVLADLVDFEAMEKFIGKETPPVLATAVDINQLFVSGAGAEILASGNFTLDNDDLETYDGFPAPEGSVTARIEGAHGLIDTLIAMGLLDSNEALGARAALNLLAVAGEGDDVLHSQIEITADGQVTANGQRIK